MCTTKAGYVELHCHSNYSMLDGASHPEELVARAKELGMEALAITDHDGLYGAVRFWQSAIQEGIQPIIGTEVTLEGGAHLTLLAEDRDGYSNLCRLISTAQLTHDKHRAALAPAVLAKHSKGLICLSGCRNGGIPSLLLAGNRKRARAQAEEYVEIFGIEGFWIELQHHMLPEDSWLCGELADLADRLGVGCVATNDVHYARKESHRLQDILVCIRNRTTLDAAGALLRPNSEYHLKPAEEMVALFDRYPGAVANTRVIASRCHVDLNFKGYRFPGFRVPGGETPFSHLYRLCHEGARERYQPITPAVSRQLAHELEVIYKTGLAEYFLIVWDIMRYAREKNIPGQGRGSAADSIVAYVLGITKVDPIRHNLLFERFLSEEMSGMPDIDIDFSTNHREEIIQYVYEKYGQEYTGMVANVVTYRARNALREVGRAMGLPMELIDRFAKMVNRHSPSHLEEEMETVGLFEGVGGQGAGGPVGAGGPASPLAVGYSRLAPAGPPAPMSGRAGTAPRSYKVGDGNGSASVQGLHAPRPYKVGDGEAGTQPLTPSPLHPVSHSPWAELLEFCRQIEGFPRHLSIHVGGMLITATPLVEIAPLERATAPGRVVVQFNKDDVEDMGLIKMDLLGLRTLSVIYDTLEMIRQSRGVDLDLDRVSLDDPAVYDMLCEPDNIGVFQVESRAQSQTLPKMRPRSIEDLIVEISIIRPGPLQGNMVHPYLRRRQGLEEVTYLHPSLEPILGETLGVVLFQEQVIRVAVAVAGFTPGEADMFRRAMNRHRSGTEMARIHARFLDGAVRNGLEEEAAETIFKQLAGFASYGFCKSHAAAFAKTAYDTAYLKLYYAPEFYAAILNNQPMGFYSPEVVANDAKRHGIRILPVDVNRSLAKCTVEAREVATDVGQGPVPCRPADDEDAAGQSAPPHPAPRTQNPELGSQSSVLAIRLGFTYVHGLGEAAMERLEEQRKLGPYHSLADFLRRTRLSREAVENLIVVGAMDCFGRPRREMLWEAGVEGRGDGGRTQNSEPRTQNPSPITHYSSPPVLPTLTPYEETAAEYSLLGMSPERHAVELFRDHLEENRAVPCDRLADLPSNLVVRVGGLVVCEQAPPTAKGHVFLTLEDETGLANVILRPMVYQHFRKVLQADQMVVVEGVINRQDGITNLMGRKILSLHQEVLLKDSRIKRPHRR
ncbi:MAG: DNA polymerase III subunit alpha [Bacteroidetes bacterium]|nr:DNA polymerase III subunit alpha [Bacteroidota bacterium]